jgi:hypothetical protein
VLVVTTEYPHSLGGAKPSDFALRTNSRILNAVKRRILINRKSKPGFMATSLLSHLLPSKLPKFLEAFEGRFYFLFVTLAETEAISRFAISERNNHRGMQGLRLRLCLGTAARNLHACLDSFVSTLRHDVNEQVS